jgi:hypothetical protein
MSVSKPAQPPALSELARNDVEADVRRVRQAIDSAWRSLATFPATEDVRRLVRRAADLSAEVDQWVSSPPSPDTCDRVMRDVLAIHIGTVQVARTVRAGVPIGKA